MKLMIILAYDIQSVFLQRAKLWLHIITSNISSTTYVMQLGRCIQNWYKMSLSCVVMLQSVQQTLQKLFCCVEGGKCYSTHLIFLTLVHVIMSDSQTEAAIAWETF